MRGYELTECGRCGALLYYPDELTRRGCVSCATSRLAIRSKAYSGRRGWLVSGRDQGGRAVSIFTESRAGAEVVRRKLLRGQSVELSDLVAS